MRIEVKLYGLLRPHHPGPNRSAPIVLELPEGATPQTVMAQLSLPPQLARLASVNEHQTTLDTPLNEGDRLAFFSSLVGG
jgi:molybdopterin converting factor small subunit